MAKTAKKKAAKKAAGTPRITLAEAGDAVAKAMSKHKQSRAASRLRGDIVLRCRAGQKALKAYLSEGGDPGKWQEFFQWLLDNLPKILAILLPLFA